MKFKVFIAKILCSPSVGRVIKSVLPTISFYGVKISTRTPNISASSISSIFWGFYEKAEARFILKYLKSDKDIIELGSSIGAISSLLASKRNGNKIICIEPGPGFIDDIRTNLILNGQSNFEVIAKAYSFKKAIVPFNISQANNIAGKIVTDAQNTDSILQVPTINLKEILNQHEIDSDYILVCDIEGMEVELFSHESDTLFNCKQIIIETHTTEYEGKTYTPQSITKLISDHGYKIIESYGPVYVFEK